MRSLLLSLVVLAAACSGSGDPTTPDTTPLPSTTSSIPQPTTTSTTSGPTTTTASSSTTSTTLADTTEVVYADRAFGLALGAAWEPDADFSGSGVGFVQGHSSQGLPPSYLSIAFAETEAAFDLDEHVTELQTELPTFVVDFQLLDQGVGAVLGEPSRWFAYVESFDGFEVVQRQEAAVSQDTLVTFTLISPIDFYDFEVREVVDSISSFTEIDES